MGNLVDLPSGTALSITPYYKNNPGAGAGYNFSYAPQQRVNSLANILAACANPNTGNCGSLFNDASVGTNAPADTLQAVLNIALHPGNNANQLAGLVTASPFTPTVASSDLSALTDWALALVYNGAGLSGSGSPAGIAIDGSGNVWVPVGTGGAGGRVAVFNNQGAPLSQSATSSTGGGYTSTLYNPAAIAIDQNGYAWIGNSPSASGGTAGSVSVLDINGDPQYGTGTNGAFTNGSLLAPNYYGIAVDAGNTVWVSSNATPAASNGTCFTGDGGSILPLTGSASGGVTLASNDNPVDTYTDNSSCPTYLAIDQSGDLWTFDSGQPGGKDSYAESLTVFHSDGTVANGPYNYWGLNGPNLAIGSNGNGWQFPQPPDSFTGYMVDITPAEVTSNNAAPTNSLYLVDWLTSLSWGLRPSPVALDGGNQAWTANDADDGNNYVLFEVNSSDTAVLSPMSSDGTPYGFVGWDASSGLPNPMEFTYGEGATVAVDSSGNLWVASGAGTVYNPLQLSEFVGIAVPVPTPLVSGLVGNNLGQRP